MGNSRGYRFIFSTTAAGAQFLRTKPNNPVWEDIEILDITQKKDEEKIDAIGEDWEKLRNAQKQITRFNSPVAFKRRLVAVTKKEEQPFSCAVESDGSIVAIVFGGIKKQSLSNTIAKFKIRFASVKTMYIGESGILYDGREEILQIIIEKFRSMMKVGIFDLLKLHDTIKGTPWYELVSTTQSFNGRKSQRVKFRWQTQVLDPESRKQLLHHSGKTRRNIRMRNKKLVESFDGDVVLEEISQPEQLDKFIEEAGYIVSQTYHAALNIGVQPSDEAQRAYFYELAGEGTFRAYILRAKGKPIAYTQGDLQGDTLYLWSTSYLPEYGKLAPGIVIMYQVIEHCAKNDIALLDFGWGDNVYKQRLGSHKLDIVDFRLFAERFYPWLTCKIESILDSADRHLRKLVEENGRIQQVRNAWRKWINRNNK